MYLAKMCFSHGACCATGEMCAFTLFRPQDLANYGSTDRERVKYLARYAVDSIMKDDRGRHGEYFYGKGESPEEAWNNALRCVQEHVDCYSYRGMQLRYFWFVKYRSQDEHENQHLRAIVQEIPNVVKLGAYVNANTGNLVDGYMVPFENVNGSELDEEDEDDDY